MHLQAGQCGNQIGAKVKTTDDFAVIFGRIYVWKEKYAIEFGSKIQIHSDRFAWSQPVVFRSCHFCAV